MLSRVWFQFQQIFQEKILLSAFEVIFKCSRNGRVVLIARPTCWDRFNCQTTKKQEAKEDTTSHSDILFELVSCSVFSKEAVTTSFKFRQHITGVERLPIFTLTPYLTTGSCWRTRPCTEDTTICRCRIITWSMSLSGSSATCGWAWPPCSPWTPISINFMK